MHGSGTSKHCITNMAANINQKGFYSIILQAVRNDQMLFRDTYVGWPGSVHDARVFDNSDLLRGIGRIHTRDE